VKTKKVRPLRAEDQQLRYTFGYQVKANKQTYRKIASQSLQCAHQHIKTTGIKIPARKLSQADITAKKMAFWSNSN
jgi:hypothetical protein